MDGEIVLYYVVLTKDTLSVTFTLTICYLIESALHKCMGYFKKNKNFFFYF